MQIPVMSHVAMMGELGNPRDFEDESEVDAQSTLCVSGEGSAGEVGEGGVSSRGNGGALRDRPVKVIPCPRCQSMNTKFCYYNNYSVNQPRHFCRNCQRYWTVGGTLRNVPVGGGSRKKMRTRGRNDAYLAGSGSPLDAPPAPSSSSDMTELLSANSRMAQLAMMPSTLGGIGIPGLGMAPFPNPFLPGFQQNIPDLFPPMPPLKSSPLSGLQEVPDLQSFYDFPHVPQLSPGNSAPMMMSNTGFFLPDLQSGRAHNESLASVLAKAGLWSSPAQQLQALTSGWTPSGSAWADQPLGGKANSLPSQQFSHMSGYEPSELKRGDPIGVTPMSSKLAPLQAGVGETPLMPSRPVMNDRQVPHARSNSWKEPNSTNTSLSSTNISPNSANISPNSSTTEEERCPPSNCFGYNEDAVSQPWVGLQASDILQF